MFKHWKTAIPTWISPIMDLSSPLLEGESVVQGLLKQNCHFTRLSMKSLINLVMELLHTHLIDLQNITELEEHALVINFNGV